MESLPSDIVNLLPKESSNLILNIEREVIGEAIFHMFHSSVDFFYTQDKKVSKNDVSHHLCKIQTVLDMTWEKLNTGHWKDANLSWRYLYSYATIFKSLFILLRKEGSYQEDAIKTCDLGLIMGASVHDNLLCRIASVLSEEINALKQNEDINNKLEAKKRMHFKPAPIIQPEREIKRIKCPSLEAFKTYMSEKKPIIIEDAINYWPALSTHKWNIDYILGIAGCRLVPIEIGSKYTDESWSQKLVTLKDFIKNYILQPKNEVGYLAQYPLFEQIQELRADIDTPTYCCLAESKDEVEVNAWFGPEGTVSPLHYDFPNHNLLAQAMGEKYIRLYCESSTPMLYPHKSTLLQNTSQVDVENPDLQEYPLFNAAPYQECILKTGNLLYIPPKCWHYVRSLSVSFSVSFWWQ